MLSDSVIEKPTFEKVANLKLPNEISKWEDEILNKFYEDVSYLPTDYGVEIHIENVDNKGYAEGSVIVWNKDKTVNFPIVVKDFILSQFDIIRTEGDSDGEYKPADEDLVLGTLSNNNLGVPSRYHPYNTDVADVKSPGGIPPKRSLWVDSGSSEFIKRSSINRKDFEKVSNELKSDSIKLAFMENTGETINKLHNEYDRISMKKKEPIKSTLTLMGSVVRKEINNIVEDDSVMDPGNYQPLESGKGKVVTLRSKIHPSVDDFIKNNPNSIEVLKRTKEGVPVNGILLKYYSIGNRNCNFGSCDGEMFISLDGKQYCKDGAYDISFFGKPVDKPVKHGIVMISEKTTDNFSTVTMDNSEDGSDLWHRPVLEFDGGRRGRNRNRSVKTVKSYDIDMVAISKNENGEYSAYIIDGPTKCSIVNGVKVYNNDHVCVAPTAGIKSFCQVNGIGGTKGDITVPDNLKTFVCPLETVFINLSTLKKRRGKDFLRPKYSIRDVIGREVKIANLSFGDRGYKIESECFEPIKKIAGISNDQELSTKETCECLKIMGVKEANAKEAMKLSLKKRASESVDPVVIYGVHSNYINDKPVEKIAKSIEKAELIEQYIKDELTFNTVKIASMLDDPEAVENILNINFINSENLNEFVDSITEFENVRNKLAKMLQASRMGLGDIDEEATKKAMDTMGICVENLRALKGALGK